MTDPWTVVVPELSTGSYACRGYIGRDEALRNAARHAKAEVTRWQDMLADLRAGRVRVFHQCGQFKVTSRTELAP